jgi:hypothetical protein
LREVSFFREVIVICQAQRLLEPEPADLKVAVLHEDEVRVHGVKWHIRGRYGLACISLPRVVLAAALPRLR